MSTKGEVGIIFLLNWWWWEMGMSTWTCHKVVLRQKLESEIWQRFFEICKVGELLDH